MFETMDEHAEEERRIKQVFSRNLRQIARERGWNAKQLAGVIGFHYNTVRYWLHGERVPALPDLLRVSQQLGVTPGMLIDLGDTEAWASGLRAALSSMQDTIDSLHSQLEAYVEATALPEIPAGDFVDALGHNGETGEA